MPTRSRTSSSSTSGAKSLATSSQGRALKKAANSLSAPWRAPAMVPRRVTSSASSPAKSASSARRRDRCESSRPTATTRCPETSSTKSRAVCSSPLMPMRVSAGRMGVPLSRRPTSRCRRSKTCYPAGMAPSPRSTRSPPRATSHSTSASAMKAAWLSVELCSSTTASAAAATSSMAATNIGTFTCSTNSATTTNSSAGGDAGSARRMIPGRPVVKARSEASNSSMNRSC